MIWPGICGQQKPGTSTPNAPESPGADMHKIVPVAILACGMVLLASCSASAPAAGTAHHATSAVPSGPVPTFSYPGSPQCAITYASRPDGRMIWTATTTVGGQLITHAGDKSGNIYRHVVRVSPGQITFVAPVPLSRIDDIGGVLTGASKSYACSIAPA